MSATAATDTGRASTVLAVSPFSFSRLTAVTVSVKSASLSAGGVRVRPLN